MRRIRLHRPHRRPLRDWIGGKVQRWKRIVVFGLAIHAGVVIVGTSVVVGLLLLAAYAAGK